MDAAGILPKDVDSQSRSEELGLVDLQKSIPVEYGNPSEARSWWTLFRVLLCIASCLGLLSLVEIGSGWQLLWQVPALAVLWVVYGMVLVGLFVVGHECGHYSFSRHRWVNNVIGHLVMAPIMNGLQTWRVTHDHHHRHTQLRGQEVDWAAHLVTREEYGKLTWRKNFLTKLGYKIPYGIFIWISMNTIRRGFFIRNMLGPEKFRKEKGKILGSNMLMLLVTASVYGAWWYTTGFLGMMKYHGIPAFIAAAFGCIIVTIQHANEYTLVYSKKGWSPVRGQLVSTFDVRFPRWIEWLWCDITIHIPHHVLPGIPWYHLRKAGRALRGAFPKYYQEYPFRFRDFGWAKKAPFLEESKEKGFYEMDIPHTRRAG